MHKFISSFLTMTIERKDDENNNSSKKYFVLSVWFKILGRIIFPSYISHSTTIYDFTCLLTRFFIERGRKILFHSKRKIFSHSWQYYGKYVWREKIADVQNWAKWSRNYYYAIGISDIQCITSLSRGMEEEWWRMWK